MPSDVSRRRWVFLRHGQSEANAARRLAGWRDSPLTRQGQQQARSAGADMAGEVFAHAVCSDLIRAHDTARLALEAWVEATGHEAPALQVRPELRERHLGEAQDLPIRVARERGLMARLITWRGAPSGGESHAVLAARLLPCLADWETSLQTPGTALVVAHGGVIRVLLGLVDGLPHEAIGTNKIANCVPHGRELEAGAWAALQASLGL